MPPMVVIAQGMFKWIPPCIFRVSMLDYIVCGQDQLPVVTSKVYNAVANLWKPWLTEEAITTLRKGKCKIYSALFFVQLILFGYLLFAWVCQFWRVSVPRFPRGLTMFESRGVAWMVSGPRSRRLTLKAPWQQHSVTAGSQVWVGLWV